jgi:hypothetical protein
MVDAAGIVVIGLLAAVFARVYAPRLRQRFAGRLGAASSPPQPGRPTKRCGSWPPDGDWARFDWGRWAQALIDHEREAR